MLNFYLFTVIFWFVITILVHIIFYSRFIKARNIIREKTNCNSKIWGYFKTTMFYLLISFIPILRFIYMYCYIGAIFYTYEAINAINKRNGGDI